MSFDIIVATRNPPTRAMVESHLRAARWRLTLTGDLSPDTGIVAESRGLIRSKYLFSLSGPQPAENEDFPAPIQRLIRGAGYLLEMNLPWGLSERELKLAFALCEDLARQCQGAVFDPQDYRIVFPSMPEVASRKKPVRTRIRQLSLEWFLPASEVRGAAGFLSVAQRVWSDATPVRFGSYEPLRYKMAEPGADTQFEDLWADAHTGLFWQSKRPVLGGSVFRSPELPEPPGRRGMVHLAVTVNASGIEGDAALCDQAVELFAGVAHELGAFFGVGYVTRGVLVGTRGTTWYDAETERVTFSFGPWWIGIPPISTWLSWFGEPYVGPVSSSVRNVASSRNGGLLIRLGSAPMDSDQVRGVAPVLPSELLLSVPPDNGDVATTFEKRIELVKAERSPAAFIPFWD